MHPTEMNLTQQINIDHWLQSSVNRRIPTNLSWKPGLWNPVRTPVHPANYPKLQMTRSSIIRQQKLIRKRLPLITTPALCSPACLYYTFKDCADCVKTILEVSGCLSTVFGPNFSGDSEQAWRNPPGTHQPIPLSGCICTTNTNCEVMY